MYTHLLLLFSQFDLQEMKRATEEEFGCWTEPSRGGSASILCLVRRPRGLGETRSWSLQWNAAVGGEDHNADGFGPGPAAQDAATSAVLEVHESR